MNSSINENPDARRRRQRLTATIKQSMRELRLQLSLLNLHVGAQLDLKDVDLNCLDLIASHGPLSPSALARRARLHPAIRPGISSIGSNGRLIARERPADRRAVVVRALHARNADLVRLYSGMNTSMDHLGHYGSRARTLAEFLRVTASRQSATEDPRT
jgi:plasmid stabilization system protein ParE